MCLHRTYWEEWEKTNLAPYASKSDDKKLAERLHEPLDYENIGIRDPAGSESRFRTSFQIDKDRILNSTAFRRLEYKTQIFVNHEGDNYRTRLTHTTEVSSIARRIAKAMRLNEDLVEAIALGHDLGHTPFGHAGEEALNKRKLLGSFGFYHNVHGLRIVDELEDGYDWDRRNDEDGGGKGLNLTYAVREGILKHTDRGLGRGITNPPFNQKILENMNPSDPPTLEAQVVALADEIAQRANDLEDGLLSGLISKEDVMKLIGESIPDDEIKLMWLIRAEKWPERDNEIVNRRREKYLKIVKSCKEKENSPSMANIIGLIRDLWTTNATEYSRINIKNITEVSKKLHKTFERQINAFMVGTEEEILSLDGIDPVGKLRQEKLKKGEEDTAEFCEIEIFKENQKPVARIKIINRTYKRDPYSEKLVLVLPPEMEDGKLINDVASTDYFIKWISSDMAVWRTQRVIVLVKFPEGEIYKNYPVEQVKIRIKEDVISFNKGMEDIDKKFKNFIERHIHRSPKVARMNTKGVRLIEKVFAKFIENPFQLHKNVWKKYPGNKDIVKIKDIKELDDFIEQTVKVDPAFKQCVAEHIAGMTDRFLINEYERLFLPSKYVEEKEEKLFSE